MKKILFICITLLIASCSSLDNENNTVLKLLPIDEANTPQSFIFNSTYTISIKYSLPDGCHVYHSLYYQYKDSTRIVAVRAIEYLDRNCTQSVVQKELKFPVKVLQKKDYVFKFWKGKDNTGKDIFEERIVPVN